ncbi:MAG: ABC transporter permease [Acidimicrobiales bacterium]
MTPWGRRVAPALAVLPVGFLALLFAWPLGEVLVRGLSWSALVDVVGDADVRRTAWFTLWQAVVSAAATLAVGLPAALVLARTRFPGRTIVRTLLTVPFALPTVVVGAAFLAVLPESWSGTPQAVVVAHVLFNLAVVVRTVGALAERLDPRLEEAAAVLGAPRWRVLVEVTLPLLRPAIVAATGIVLLFCATSFGVALLLGGPRYPTLEVEVYRRTTQVLDLGGAATIATAQLAVLGVLLLWWTSGEERRSARTRAMGAVVPPRPLRTGRRRLGTALALAVPLGLVLVPTVALVRRSMGSGGTPATWLEVLRGDTAAARFVDVPAAVRTSLVYAGAATLIAVVVGGLAAAAIAYGGRARRVLDVALLLPLGTSAVTVGLGLLLAFDTPPLDLRSSPVLVPLAHALVAVPFVVRIVLPVLRAIDPRQREAAAMLGAPPWQVWRAIDAPVTARALAAGAGFAAAISLGEFGATSFLSRRDSTTVPVAIGQLLGRPGSANATAAYVLALVLALAVAAIMVVVDRFRSNDGTW